MKSVKTLCAVATAVCGIAATSQASLVVNGSFEDGAFVDNTAQDTMDLIAGSTDITGWTTTTANLAWIGPSNPFGLTASQGGYFLDLSGYHDNQPYGGVAASTSISTVINQQYQVTFDLGSDVNYNSASPSVQVIVSGIPSLATFTAGTITGSTLNRWENFVFVFTATTANTTLSFAGVGANNQKYVGLDNVTLVAVPEPATMIAGALLLLPFGASTFRFFRKNRTA